VAEGTNAGAFGDRLTFAAIPDQHDQHGRHRSGEAILSNALTTTPGLPSPGQRLSHIIFHFELRI
jgi:hypothetical protein